MHQHKLYTLIFVKRNSEILLGLKKRGMGVGKWNGFGGKVEKNETIVEGARRELKEESNLDSDQLKHIGVVSYEVENRNYLDVVHIFTTVTFSGELSETEEMKPRWYRMDGIPFGQMWPDAKLWYPYVLKDIYFSTYIKYDHGIDRVKSIATKRFENCEEFVKFLTD